jgi:hypothetical protein
MGELHLQTMDNFLCTLWQQLFSNESTTGKEVPKLTKPPTRARVTTLHLEDPFYSLAWGKVSDSLASRLGLPSSVIDTIAHLAQTKPSRPGAAKFLGDQLLRLKPRMTQEHRPVHLVDAGQPAKLDTLTPTIVLDEDQSLATVIAPEPIFVSQSLSEQDDMLARCEQRVGYTFKQRALLKSALTHASGADHRLASNERMEFLGDAILGYVVCELLFRAFPSISKAI